MAFARKPNESRVSAFQVQLERTWDLADRAKLSTTSASLLPLGRLESAHMPIRVHLPHRVPDHALHRSQKPGGVQTSPNKSRGLERQRTQDSEMGER